MQSALYLRYALHAFVSLLCGLNAFIAHSCLSIETIRVIGDSVPGWIVLLNAAGVVLLVMNDHQSTYPHGKSFLSHCSQGCAALTVLLTASASGAIFYTDQPFLAIPSLAVFALESLDFILVVYSCLTLYPPQATTDTEMGPNYVSVIPDADFWRMGSFPVAAFPLEKAELATPLLTIQTTTTALAEVSPAPELPAWWSL